MATKKKYKDYAEYLKSDKWKQIKEDYAEANSHNDCVFCSSDNDMNHHHWQYPKDWNNDSHNNIVKVCSECHEHIHSNDIIGYVSILDFIKAFNCFKADMDYEANTSNREFSDSFINHVAEIGAEVSFDRTGQPLKVEILKPLHIQGSEFARLVLKKQQENNSGDF